ncbi:MAG: peptidoglycan-binding protein [Amylibacter sp.]|nr:peptidoglycan-binding protein [Amylibacter sp.]
MARIRAVIATCIIGVTGFSSSFSYAQSSISETCFTPYTAPAVIETVTEQVLVQEEVREIDPETGQSVVTSPAIYSTKTIQKIITDRSEAQIQIVCAKDQNRDFIQTLQRALTARGFYDSAINGRMDDRTKRAVRKVQKSYGVNISDVTIELAENYGLIIHRLFAQ